MNKRILIAVLAAAAIGGTIRAADAPAPTAATYTQQAATFRAEAERHEKMAQMHRAGAGSQKVNHENIVRHCEKIAQDLRAAADESDALAKELEAGGQ